jgi:mannose-1-phosphate guanylyltransferase/mannose-6-phosphate isomerase
MLRTDSHLWNSGIFMMKVSVWLAQLDRHRADIAQACRSAYQQGRSDGDFYRPAGDLFAACPNDSIDYAVMEKLAGKGAHRRPDLGGPHGVGQPGASDPECVVVPMDAQWSDVGSWAALWEEGNQDEHGNVVQGDAYLRSMANSLVFGQHRMVAAVGLENLILVETADAVLVAHKDRVQEVKDLVARLKAENRSEQENHRKVHRPWGTFEIVDAGSHFQVKRLTVNPGAALSLQLHHHRAEHWVVVRGTAKVTKGDEEFLLAENQSTYVPLGTAHRLENPGTLPLEIIEVQSGSYLGEDDIVRFADRYNRHHEIGSSSEHSAG